MHKKKEVILCSRTLAHRKFVNNRNSHQSTQNRPRLYLLMDVACHFACLFLINRLTLQSSVYIFPFFFLPSFLPEDFPNLRNQGGRLTTPSFPHLEKQTVVQKQRHRKGRKRGVQGAPPRPAVTQQKVHAPPQSSMLHQVEWEGL